MFTTQTQVSFHYHHHHPFPSIIAILLSVSMSLWLNPFTFMTRSVCAQPVNRRGKHRWSLNKVVYQSL